MAIEKISVNEVIQEALSDTDAIEASKIIRSQETPKLWDLFGIGLTESNWAAFKEFSIPGGPASPLTPFLLGEIAAEAKGKVLPTTVVTMGHGSLIPIGEDAVSYIHREALDRNEYAQPGLLNLYIEFHAGSSCGVSEGRTTVLRKRYADNLVNYMRDNSGSNIDLHPIEAYVGKRNPNIKVDSPAAFDLHNPESIYYYRPEFSELEGIASSEALPKLPDSDRDALMDRHELNRLYRACISEGRSIRGIVCLDNRTGQTRDSFPMDVEQLAKEVNPRLRLNSQRYATGWQLYEHSEFPLALLNVGEEDKMTRIGWWLMDHQLAVSRSGYYFAASSPAMINVPETMFDPGNKAQADLFVSQVTQLVSNLDRQTYGRGWTGPKTRSYIQIDDRLLEVDMEGNGLQVAHSQEVAEKYLKGATFPRWTKPEIAWDRVNPNPRLSKSFDTMTKVLGSRARRPIGPVV